MRVINIILADDDILTQKILGIMFKNEDWNFTVVSTGEELIEELQKKNYNIAIIDLMMPVINGLDALKLIIKNKKIEKQKIIIITACIRTIEIDKCLEELEIKYYLEKPLNRNQLKEIIKKIGYSSEES